MSEVEKYTTEMWQRHVGAIVAMVNASSSKQRAFIDGFNGKPATGIHHLSRGAHALGRHSAVLLGYIA